MRSSLWVWCAYLWYTDLVWLRSRSLPLSSSSTPTASPATTSSALTASSSSSRALGSSDAFYIPLTQLQSATTKSSHTRIANSPFSFATTASKSTSSSIRPFLPDPFKHNSILFGLPPPLRLSLLFLLLNAHPLMFWHVLLSKNGRLGAEFEETEIGGFMAVLARGVGRGE